MINEFEETEDKEKCRCGNDAVELHTCPYAEDICNDFETLCNCCAECQYECVIEI